MRRVKFRFLWEKKASLGSKFSGNIDATHSHNLSNMSVHGTVIQSHKPHKITDLHTCGRHSNATARNKRAAFRSIKRFKRNTPKKQQKEG